MKAIITYSLLFASVLSFAQKAEADPFVCPPCNNNCDNLTFDKAGKCPHCGMELIQKSKLLKKKMTICFYLQDGVEVLDFAGPMEVFSYAGAKIFTVSKTKNPIKSQGILKVTPDYDIIDAPPFDILAVFGGNSGNASEDPEVINWIKTRKPTTQYYFSVCTGAFILGKAGLLDNLTVTTFHESIERLQKAVPSAKVLPDTRFVDNGTIITTAGISAGIDGALHLVEKLGGKESAIRVATYMEYDKWIPGQGLIVKNP
ncbi:DJ-1/PfpI family protein [Emticicia sp. BO119]|uniref:DJ-1/PfpI family protein n=1 Tax=Emticicia sp. BO119 TaxID=2757768 RepID=UPI0015F01FB9|nr:DJ-1/PfpI family protein [Emticicia sp. BO119]MBA4853819.1 DJ-1/PfpI family protein [Emticicia sp. BO119]